ncbi:MAG: T9SS type A sorting domain-containing protein, partial [Marinirhabdus sp.]|nr:T9SS type A sorting domain-containing protein [Marinirhabdus sp.]
LNSRDAMAGGTAVGDLGPEGLVYVSAEDSPTDTGMIVVANEVSGTLSIYSLDNDLLSTEDFDLQVGTNFTMFPNPSNGTVYLSKQGNYTITDVLGREIRTIIDTKTLQLQTLNAGIYLVSNEEGVTKRLIIK